MMVLLTEYLPEFQIEGQICLLLNDDNIFERNCIVDKSVTECFQFSFISYGCQEKYFQFLSLFHSAGKN